MSYQLAKLSPRIADHFLVVGCGDVVESQLEVKIENLFDACTWAIQPSIIDRYPREEREDVSFPQGIALFCFPNGLTVSKVEKAPSFHSFVHTSEEGSRILGCCLTFYEKLTAAQIKSIKLCLNPDTTENSFENDKFRTYIEGYYLPKCMCITSNWPFVTAFKSVLCELFRITLSPSSIPLERYICNFIDDVPSPPAGIVDITFYLGEKDITFKCPPANQPNVWTGLPVYSLFECLSPENVILLFSAVLVERQIVFVSSQYTLLTACSETIASLIYPFTWSHVYVPILPRTLMEVLSAPVPYMVGVHSSFLYKTSLQQVNGPKGIEYVEVEEKNKAYCIGSETIQIFLDENRIDVGSSGTYPPPLPDHAGRKLLRVIEQHAPSYAQRGSRWHDQQLPLYDSAFKTAAPPSAVDDWDTPETLGMVSPPDKRKLGKNRAKAKQSSNVKLPIHFSVNEELLRKGFLNFFVGTLLNYRRYLLYDVPLSSPLFIGFRLQDFVDDVAVDSSMEFLRGFIFSQAFSQFVVDRIALPELAASAALSLSAYHGSQNHPGHRKSAEDKSSLEKLQSEQRQQQQHLQTSVNSVYDIVFFDESIDAKWNRYALQRLGRKQLETPFLNHSSTNHIKTYVPNSPNTLGLPDGVEYFSPTFPTFRPEYFCESNNQTSHMSSWKQVARAKSFVPLKRVSGPVIPLSSSPKAEKALSVGSGTAISCAYSCYLSVLMSTIISTKVKSTATMEAPATPAGSNSVDGLTCDCTSSFQNQEYCLHCDRAAHVGLQVGIEVFNALTRLNDIPSDEVFRLVSQACAMCGSAVSSVSLLIYLTEEGVAPDFTMLTFVATSIARFNETYKGKLRRCGLSVGNDESSTDASFCGSSPLSPDGEEATNDGDGGHTATCDIHWVDPTEAWTTKDWPYLQRRLLGIEKKVEKLCPSTGTGKFRAFVRRSIVCSSIDNGTPLFGLSSRDIQVPGSPKASFMQKLLHSKRRYGKVYKKFGLSRSNDNDHGTSDLIGDLPTTSSIQWSWVYPGQDVPGRGNRRNSRAGGDDSVPSNFMNDVSRRLKRLSSFGNVDTTLISLEDPIAVSDQTTAHTGATADAVVVPVKLKVTPPYAATCRLMNRMTFSEHLLLQKYLMPSSASAHANDHCAFSIDLNHPYGVVCPNRHCGKPLTYEQMEAGWCFIGDSSNTYTTKCHACDANFVPRFVVNCERNEMHQPEREVVEPVWCEMVSPWVLMKEIQMILCQDGGLPTLLSPPSFNSKDTKNNSVLFWNMIVLFRRYGLPYSFLLTDGSLCRSFAPQDASPVSTSST